MGARDGAENLGDNRKDIVKGKSSLGQLKEAGAVSREHFPV